MVSEDPVQKIEKDKKSKSHRLEELGLSSGTVTTHDIFCISFFAKYRIPYCSQFVNESPSALRIFVKYTYGNVDILCIIL
jgi:hypothetical protein